MINHIKSLLSRANALREELETFDTENEDTAEIDELIDSFRKFQKAIPLTFFSEYPVDNQYPNLYAAWRDHSF